MHVYVHVCVQECVVVHWSLLRPAYTGRLPADLSHATQMNMDKCSANHQ